MRPPRHRRRAALAASLCAVVLAACGDGDLERDDAGRVEVGDLRLEVPEGWQHAVDEVAAPLVLQERFTDPDVALQQIQVVVGCDPSGLDALVSSLGAQPRGQVQVVDAHEHLPAPTVSGLEQARRVSLDLGVSPEVPATSVTHGLYGERGDALVLVEVNVPLDEGDVDADEVLASVVADGEALAARCDG